MTERPATSESNPVASASPFASLNLSAPLTQALDVLGFASMTEVQAKALPVMLAGQDVTAQARTGSGKTIAFGLAALARVDVMDSTTQALVLCPTRELAEQVAGEMRKLARFIPNLRVVTLCGGVPVRSQLSSVQKTPHVIVGTPGRVQDHLTRGTITLRDLRVFVLDEADRMLDMGFIDDIRKIVLESTKKRQTLMFSATFPEEIRTLSQAFQKSPVAIATEDAEVAHEDIVQEFFLVDASAKLFALQAILQSEGDGSALVFCQTRQDVRDVSEALRVSGFSALALHGELEQRERDEVLTRFANQSCSVLVATDVAARGIDIKELAAVISYELSPDADIHRHRIGRTGRAGKVGRAIALVADDEKERVARIEEATGLTAQWSELPMRTERKPSPAPMVTLLIGGGRQDKLRPGDLLGALTGDVGLPGEAVGAISIGPRHAYVAIRRAEADAAFHGLQAHKIKGRTFRVWRLE